REIVLIRSLIQKHIDNVPLVKGLTDTLGKLCKIHSDESIRSGQLLSKQTLQRVVMQMINAVTQCFSDLPDYNERIDRLKPLLLNAVMEAQNNPGTKLLR